VAQAAAAAPVYSYPMAAPQATARRFGASQIAIAGVLLAILAFVTIGATAFAVSQAIGGKQAVCTVNCAPKFVTPLPEARTFRSAAFKYEVDYSSAWTVRSQDANGIVFGTRLGTLTVAGTRSTAPLDQAIKSTVSALPSAQWQNVVLADPKEPILKGAHIGDQNGLGAVYSANLIGANSTTTKVQFAVIAATRGGVTVVILAIDPADPKNSPHGIPEAQDFDYLCAEFRWP
jgi:hypothetical protein